MTRILYWNIDNFTAETIDDARLGILPAYGVPLNQAASDRFDYILEQFGAKVPAVNRFATPDIFVVVEVNLGRNGFSGRGRIATPRAGFAARLLLDNIRVMTGNNNWMLVPPLQTGPDEAVAVYYDSTNYVFAGPWIWPGGQGPSQDPAQVPDPAAQMQPYQDYVGTLPGRTVPVGLPNAGRAEARLAAANVDGHPVPYAPNRRTPYRVSFGELAGGAVQRTLSLFVVHGPAGNREATAYLTGLAALGEITAPNAANEVRLILGDFNLNLLANGAGVPPAIVQTGAYANLTGIGYQLGIAVQPPGQQAPNPPAGTSYRGYFATHLRPLNRATYWYIGNSADFYPAYGYTGSTASATNDFSLDNVLVRFGGGLAAPALTHVTVLNGVVGTPYMPNNLLQTPLGYYMFPMQMAAVAEYQDRPLRIPQPPVNPPPDPRTVSFRQWQNFGRIRSTSDHMPLLFDV